MFSVLGHLSINAYCVKKIWGNVSKQGVRQDSEAATLNNDTTST